MTTHATAVDHNGATGHDPGAAEIGFDLHGPYNASAILFDNLAAGRGDRPAVLSPTGGFTYAELARRAGRIGNALLALGLLREERVLLLLDDTGVYPAALFGAIRSGLVPIPTSTLLPPDLLRFYIQDAGVRVAVTDAVHAGKLAAAAADGTLLDAAVVVNGGADVPGVARVEQGDHWFASFPAELPAADTRPDDLAFLQYSSGSTGRPKGVVHRQRHMAYTVAAYGRHVLTLGPDDICFSGPKLFFGYGLGNSITFPFAAGAASLLYPGRIDAASVFDCIRRYRPTVFFGVPTLYSALLADPALTTVDLASLRLCISAGEVLPENIFARWKELSGLDIVEGLGSTEMLHIYLSNRPTLKKPGAAGWRLPGYEVALKDRRGREVADGEEGVLWVRGGSAAPCYWNRPDKTATTMRDGWIRSGDRFVRDSDGFYFFRGRDDDLIKVSGQWVHPLEVQCCLAAHPAVRACVVLGVRLPDGRSTLKAFVALQNDGAASAVTTALLQAHVKQRLEPHKYPRLIEYVDDFPKTATGKIDRQALLNAGASPPAGLPEAVVAPRISAPRLKTRLTAPVDEDMRTTGKAAAVRAKTPRSPRPGATARPRAKSPASC